MVFHDLYEPWHGLIISGKHAVLAKVRHSQKMNDPTVPLWIITEDDGRILCAHCWECMAGQGETCSHIASVVFYIETFNRIREKLACNEKQCEWIVILPTYSKDIPFAEVQDIDFRPVNKLKQKIDANALCFFPEDSKTTEKQHWVCICSVGCSDGIVNLYDSLYHNVISKEVEEQAINLVGADSFSSLNVVEIPQQHMHVF